MVLFRAQYRNQTKMVLECVRVRSLPNNARDSDIEADWSDLNIAPKGVLHITNRFYVFFNNSEDAEDAVNRGFRHDHVDFKAKRLRYSLSTIVVSKCNISAFLTRFLSFGHS